MTVGAIVDRLYRTYLYPPNARPAQCFLNGAITDVAGTLVVQNFVLPEDAELMAAGVVLEIGSELIQVVTYDDATSTATVNRGVMGTTNVAHNDDDPVLLAPPYPRLSVFQSVADNIITLYPRLYTVTTGSVTEVAAGLSAIDDPLAVEVVEAWPDGFHNDIDIDARIVDYHPATGGRTLITNVSAGQVWVRYRRRFGDAQSETDTLASLGMEERWVNIVMAGAAADVFAGQDLSASHTEWVGAALQAENIPVGTRSQLSRTLVAYKEHLLLAAQKEMRAEYRAKSHMRGAGQVVTRSAWS
jgi:hypothetical protein